MTLRRRAVPTAVIAILALAAAAPSAHADQVTAALSQQQSNRLSILHDYGLDLVGDSTGDGAGPAGHAAGGYLGEVPLVGTPGQGAAAAILTKVSSKLTFLQGIQSTDDTPTGRNFDLSLGYASGYDSNPKANPYARDGSFIAGTFTAGYHLVDGPDDPVIGSALRADVAYNVVAVAYSGPRADADGVQQGLNGSVRDSLLGDRLVATGSVNDQFTMEHGEAFLNTTDVAAAAEAFATYHLSVEGGYDYAHLQYFFRPVDDAQKPTAERHSLDARLHLYPVSQERGIGIPNTDAGLGLFVEQALRRATLGYAHVWNFPDQQTGTDYRYQSDRVFVGLEGLTLPPSIKLFGQPIAQGTSASVFYAHEFQSFAFDNSLTPAVLNGTGPGHPRRDNLDVLTIRSNTRILDFAHHDGTLATFLQVDLVHDGANVPARHFNELIVSSGLSYVY